MWRLEVGHNRHTYLTQRVLVPLNLLDQLLIETRSIGTTPLPCQKHIQQKERQKKRDLLHDNNKVFHSHITQVQACDCTRVQRRKHLEEGCSLYYVCTKLSTILQSPNVVMIMLLGSHFRYFSTRNQISICQLKFTCKWRFLDPVVHMVK